MNRQRQTILVKWISTKLNWCKLATVTSWTADVSHSLWLPCVRETREKTFCYRSFVVCFVQNWKDNILVVDGGVKKSALSKKAKVPLSQLFQTPSESKIWDCTPRCPRWVHDQISIHMPLIVSFYKQKHITVLFWYKLINFVFEVGKVLGKERKLVLVLTQYSRNFQYGGTSKR